MNKLIIRLLTFLFFFILLGFGIYKVGFSVNQPFEGTYNQVQYVISNRDTIKYITLGNSHAASVDFITLGVKGGYDLSAGFMDVFEMVHLANYLLPKMTELKQVFIPIPFYFFQFDNAAYDDEYQLSFRKRTYFMTPQLFLIGNDPSNLIQAKVSPIVRPDHWRGVSTTLLKEFLNKVAVLRPVKDAIVTNDFLNKHAIGRVKQNKTQADTMLYSRKTLIHDAESEFVNLIDLFKKLDIEPIFYTPSYYKAYTERFDKTIKNKTQEIIYRLKREKGVVYFNFSEDSALSHNKELYKDSDHYNSFGKVVFSKQLRDSLVKINELKK